MSHGRRRDAFDHRRHDLRFDCEDDGAGESHRLVVVRARLHAECFCQGQELGRVDVGYVDGSRIATVGDQATDETGCHITAADEADDPVGHGRSTLRAPSTHYGQFRRSRKHSLRTP